MKVIKYKKELIEVLQGKEKRGLVPTMGALHQGHISLLIQARQNNECLVSSLFVNPTQFTNPQDLEHYPRPLEQDLEILKKNGVDIAFVPDASEIYRDPQPWHMELGNLDKVLEGISRPGHFQGVTQIVKILFDLVKPDKAYFGLKDYQQFLVIKKLVEFYHLPLELVGCPIIREPDGLAMSSRNLHLSSKNRSEAIILFQALSRVYDQGRSQSPDQLRNLGRSLIERVPGIDVEYFDICDQGKLISLKQWTPNIEAIALVAARVGNTRLIDNMFLK
jgi:pantoate--beta-alanine ligase